MRGHVDIAELQLASADVVALEKHVAQGSEALRTAREEGSRAGREAAQVHSTAKEIASLREELRLKASRERLAG